MLIFKRKGLDIRAQRAHSGLVRAIILTFACNHVIHALFPQFYISYRQAPLEVLLPAGGDCQPIGRSTPLFTALTPEKHIAAYFIVIKMSSSIPWSITRR